MRKWFAVPCALALAPLAARAQVPQQPTFSEHVAPIVFQNCTGCHRPGQVAPFTLLNYEDTRKRAKTILRVVESRYMPPWHPDKGHGEFRNERRLTDDQIKTIAKWVENGAPEGNPKNTPALPRFPDGWQIKQPDLVVKMDRPFAVPASGPDIYQNFVIPLNLPEDKWVTAVEFRASAPVVLHHLLYFLDDTGTARKLAAKDGQPGFPAMGSPANAGRPAPLFRPTGMLGGWAVGGVPVPLPDGLALPLPRKSDLVVQAHFHLSGKEEQQTLEIGLHFADKKPARALQILQLPPAFGLFANINIPAGAKEFTVKESFTLPVDTDFVGVGAHAHYLGKTMKAHAVLPSGRTEKLFSISDWDFNWQSSYLYKEYVRLPKGTVIHAELTWDNTADNPRHPTRKPVDVSWGEGSLDEMGAITFRVLAANTSEEKALADAVTAHRFDAVKRSMQRGDDIQWEKHGIERPLFWKPAPKKGAPKPAPAAPPPVSLRDLDGKEHTPLAGAAKATVLVFTTTDCPIANGYAPEVAALAKDFAGRGVRFYAVHVDPGLTADAARAHAKEYGLAVPVLIDAKHELVAATGATRTPEAVVLGPDGAVAYRGRVNDLYAGLGKKRQVVTSHDLRDAVAAVLDGKPVGTPRTEAVGCSIPDLPKR